MSHLILLTFSMRVPAIDQDAPPSATPKVHKIAVGGEGGWDYLTVAPDARRLYVSRGDRVTVLDLDEEAIGGELADTPGVHGIAVVPELGKGFTSNGRYSSNGGDGTVSIIGEPERGSSRSSRWSPPRRAPGR